MQLRPLKLVTVVAEAVVMDELARVGLASGATGYTLAEVAGQGSRSQRNVSLVGEARTLKIEFVVPADVAERILTYVSRQFVEHFACIAWMADIEVVRGGDYAGG
jgi:nitrogen regulatory protein P-II 2